MARPNPEDSISFFTGLAAEAWERSRDETEIAAGASYLGSRLALTSPTDLLDVPCGGGRMAQALAARGHRVVGVDGSADMLRRAQALGTDCRWLQSDMSTLESCLDERLRFGGAYCWGNSLGYHDRAGTEAFFRGVGRGLRRGGRFVIDTEMTAESVLPNFSDRLWSQVGDILMVVEHRYSVAASTLETEYRFLRDAELATCRLDHHIFAVGELSAMLATAGFDVVALESTPDGESFALGDPRLLLTAVRR